MSDGKAEAGAKVGNKMVGTLGFRFGVNADSVPGRGTNEVDEEDGQDRDGDGLLIKW